MLSRIIRLYQFVIFLFCILFVHKCYDCFYCVNYVCIHFFLYLCVNKQNVPLGQIKMNWTELNKMKTYSQNPCLLHPFKELSFTLGSARSGHKTIYQFLRQEIWCWAILHNALTCGNIHSKQKPDMKNYLDFSFSIFI